MMLSNFISAGDRVELIPVERAFGKTTEGDGVKTYVSKILDIKSEDTLELLMPMEQTKLVLLPVDAEFNMVVYGKGSLYQCFIRVVDRYKTSNLFALAVELISNLRKYQRREYYRFSCALEM
ncbi:MAG: flagellar brake protein, partial [Lachnospiraceae bacterium]|nr:flagellar brake protein [Lachnospiraceae bacterium]